MGSMTVYGALAATVADFHAAAAEDVCAHSRAPCSAVAVARVHADVLAGSAGGESWRRAIFNVRSGTHLHTQIIAA